MTADARDIPELSLVVLVGASGSGKSTFAREHFGPFETVSSDFCRGLVSDDENDQAATKDAFEVLHFIVGKRLAAGRLTVVDATNVQPDARRQLVALARAHDVLPVAIVLDVPESVVRRPQRGATRPRLRRARRQAPARPAAALAARPGEGGLPQGARALQRRGGRGRDRRAGEAAQRLPRPARALRRDRRHPRLPLRARDPARPAGLRRRPRRAGTAGRRHAPRGPARRSSSATSSTAAPTAPASCGWSWAWSPTATRSACPATTRTSSSARWTVATCRSATGSRRHWPSWPRRPRSSAPRSGRSATASSPTSSSTTAGSSSRTPASRRPTTVARPVGCGASRCTATPPARPTSSACPCATRGRRTTAAGRWCSTATRPRPSWSGSTTRCASTPASSSAAG